MEPQALKARITEIARPLDAVEVSSDMHLSLREKIAATLEAVAAEADLKILPDARSSSDPDARDEAARLYRRLAQTNSWLDGRDARSRDWIDRAAELAASDVLRDMVAVEQNRLRDPEAFAGIHALCEQGLVDKARRTLARRRRAEKDPLTRKRIGEVLADPRNFVAPIRSAPGMFTFNGLGTMLWGRRDKRPDGTHIATLCLVFFFIPILPLRAYLVRRVSEGWTFYGRVPLSPFAFWWRRIAIGGPLLATLALWGWDTWDSAAFVQEGRNLSTASAAFDRRDFPGAVAALGPMTRTEDAGRAARMDEIGRKAVTAALAEVQNPASAEWFLRSIGNATNTSKRPWADGPAAAEALDRLARSPGSGKVVRNFIEWMVSASPDFAGRKPDLAAQACGPCDDPFLLAATVEIHAAAGRAVPPALFSRLRDHLLKRRHDTWTLDTLVYLKADPPDAQAVLLVRVEAAWKGAPEPRLRELKALPPALSALFALDAEPDLEKRAAGLEKAADPGDLGEPQKTWHALGVATRLVAVYGPLNEKDPLRFPASKARPWAIRAAELAPEDAGARVAALRALLADGDLDRAIALGSPHRRDPKTAPLLGVALARSDKLQEAAEILRPLVEKDFPGFIRAVAEWERATTSKTKSLWTSLEVGAADRRVIARINALPKEQASAEAEKWVRQQVEQDSRIASLKNKWREGADVHPAASELALVELGLARALSPGAERQERLRAAEKLFLDLRTIAGDDPHQELQLGQVYFWLGKEKEGSEIFGKLEAAADPAVLHPMGRTYRELGRSGDARRVLELAYDKAQAAEKSGIALTRAVASRTSEEKLEWLRKGSVADPDIRVEIDQTEAEISLKKGAFEEAVEPLKRAAAYYAALPEDSTTLNNAAIIHLRLARATGDTKPQLEALRLMRRSHEVSPEGGIVLANYVDLLGDVGIASLAGQALRGDLLHEMPRRSWMDYLVPPVLPAEWAARAKAQPELRRAADLGTKAVVLSPGRSEGYSAQRIFFSLTRNGEAYRRLRESVESNPPPRKDAADRNRDRGETLEADKKATEQTLARWAALLPPIRKSGHAPTLAYALVQSAGTHYSAFRFGVPGSTLERALQEADEAVRTLEAPPTLLTAAWIRMELAARGHAEADPGFAAWMKENPGVSASLHLPLYARRHPERAAAIRSRDDVRRAVSALAHLERRETDTPWLWSWAWLDLAGHEDCVKVAEALRADATFLESYRLSRLLSPESPEGEAEAWLAALACGETELAAKIADAARQAKVFPALFGE